ncbi:hypothetical protein DVK85_09760 [Flavobacterium arcticum]|uniref:Uncharacterized protein n=1 Tax=Flavobacterium arcticum TaxID=1784713 RepID=A0A345HD44_9FLAO|nr:hypothetical protein [Flavobacterium arcticum]AXG74504.1 hypothetical protein DVK85_09760 [Flavobacterium arcticum]KAF2512375.1 hypothetical protein E0W72_03900 [Flavobacterium arcticum]
MNKKVKSILYNLAGYAPFFIIVYLLTAQYTELTGIMVPVTAAVVATILAPKFQVVKFQGEDKIFMKWLFTKGVKEVK